MLYSARLNIIYKSCCNNTCNGLLRWHGELSDPMSRVLEHLVTSIFQDSFKVSFAMDYMSENPLQPTHWRGKMSAVEELKYFLFTFSCLFLRGFYFPWCLGGLFLIYVLSCSLFWLFGKHRKVYFMILLKIMPWITLASPVDTEMWVLFPQSFADFHLLETWTKCLH